MSDKLRKALENAISVIESVRESGAVDADDLLWLDRECAAAANAGYIALAAADPTADPEDAETYNNVAPRADAIAACDFRPANEPWQCVVHYGIRTRLDEPQCDAIRPAKPLTPGQLANLYEADAQGRVPHNRYLVRGLLATIAALRPATPGALDAAWAEASDVVAWDWTLRLTRLVKGGYRAEAINGNKVEVYTVASDPDDALRELSDIITESHVND